MFLTFKKSSGYVVKKRNFSCFFHLLVNTQFNKPIIVLLTIINHFI